MKLSPCDHDSCPQTHCELARLNEEVGRLSFIEDRARADLRVAQDKLKPLQAAVFESEHNAIAARAELNKWWRKERKGADETFVA
jgi:hypothetical protein